MFNFEANKFVALFTMGTGQFEKNEIRIKRICFDEVLFCFIILFDLIFGCIIRDWLFIGIVMCLDKLH